MTYETIGRSDVTWAGKTNREVRSVGETDGSIAIVPIGSIEQHGNHMPVATDTILVDAVSQEAAERANQTIPLLVTPPIWTGFSPHHMSLGGTITLTFEHALHVLEDAVGSALANGFDAILIVNGHGGNIPLIGAATSTIGADHSDALIHSLTYFALAERFIDEIRESDPGGMAHAGEFETSLMLHLRPDLVREDAIEGMPMDEPYEHSNSDMFGTGTLGVYRPFEFYSETGAIGAPELATAEKGAELFDRLADELATIALDIHQYLIE